MPISRLIALILLITMVTVAVGCGQPPRRAVEGTVTLDGEPLAEGYLQLRPLPQTGGPTAGAKVVAGRFRIEDSKGPFPGEHRVEITALGDAAGYVIDEFTGEQYPATRQMLRAQYNDQSELTATVHDDRPTTLTFELESHP